MPRPLALTLGEPAGIGPDITFAAWRRRAELDLPPFYLLADPEIRRAARPAAGARPEHCRGRAGRGRGGIQDRAAGRRYRRADHRRAGQPRSIERAGGDRRHPPRGRRRRRRRGARDRHQSGRQERPLSLGLRRARTHRVSRQARRGIDRRRAASGDDAVVAGARGRAGHHPPAAEGRRCRSSPPISSSRPAASWRAICATASASRIRASPSPASIRMRARKARSARRT